MTHNKILYFFSKKHLQLPTLYIWQWSTRGT